jgi:hypothetical protein
LKPFLVIAGLLLAANAHAVSARLTSAGGRVAIAKGEVYAWTSRRFRGDPSVCIYRRGEIVFGCPTECGGAYPPHLQTNVPLASARAAARAIAAHGEPLIEAAAEAFAFLSTVESRLCLANICYRPDGVPWRCGCPAFACRPPP